jgi:hypothetical protein
MAGASEVTMTSAHRHANISPGSVPIKVRRDALVPLHDAAEVARSGIPAVMMFVQSLKGISHNKIENKLDEHLELSVIAMDRLATKTADWIQR